MSGGVVFTRDAAIRTRDAVRRVEAGIPPNTSRGIPDTNRVYVEIVTEVGSGEYTAKAVKRDGDAWVVRVNDIFTDDSIPIFEANGVTGLEVGTVVEVYRLWDETTETKYFVFFATGGGGGGGAGYAGPFAVTPHATLNDRVILGATRSSDRPDLIIVGDKMGERASDETVGIPVVAPGPAVLHYVYSRVHVDPSGAVSDTIFINDTFVTTPVLDLANIWVLIATLLADENGLVADSIEQRHYGDMNFPVTVVEFASSAPYELTYRNQVTYEAVVTTAEECTP